MGEIIALAKYVPASAVRHKGRVIFVKLKLTKWLVKNFKT